MTSGCSATQCDNPTVFDIPHLSKTSEGPDAQALQRVFHITSGIATCIASPALSAKYNVEQDNRQLVVSVTNRTTGEQAWFNEQRTRKPQTFKKDAGGDADKPADPTKGGLNCDFCNWQELTAEDTFGRIELPHAVTGSNLFKYAEPCHGLVLFKHHDPLSFSLEQLADFMTVSDVWFQRSAQEHPDARHGFFIWNALARAGASQYHGHGQLMLSRVPVPTQSSLSAAAAQHTSLHGTCYYQDLLAAHRAAGLLRSCAGDGGQGRAWIASSLAPLKDMEVIIIGDSLSCPAFVRALHASLRALIDELGCQSFNVGILNIPLPQPITQQQQPGQVDQAPAECSGAAMSRGQHHTEQTASGTGIMECGMPTGPVMARVVSRGRVAQVASDFGCLEVVGGASIGHTDPYRVIAAVEEQLQGQGLVDVAGPLQWVWSMSMVCKSMQPQAYWPSRGSARPMPSVYMATLLCWPSSSSQVWVVAHML
eukprot:CAMPEP_0202919522 /NCGR_PEP_ID=MMETSP1392-20130828/76056_1 /ASSEMBLY_ACC=CAM_ASM_000868 /TAXON_ID=225041 /ORGANISM="Chlamydomonas chlamydogama, Strain SAG 11-48b" /LENGTH=480 /DNA_ID=CAMNT_0049612915 /DNA_START=177 /DNA_END=1620 /DNA_ORIENTATION=+